MAIRRHTEKSSGSDRKLAKALKKTFEAPLVTEGESKIATLEEAIEKNFRPGMAIYVGSFANVANRELIRQFQNTKPAFTIIGGSRDYVSVLVACGLVKKLIGSGFGHIYPTPGPSHAIQRAYKEKNIEIEDWTVLTLTQRLMAGAMDMGCTITKSMIGSSIGLEAADSFKEIDDPFGSGQRLAMIRALTPDIALVHGWAADRQGNVITGAPHFVGRDVWGARASRQGVVVTVEKIVSTDFIREHSSLVTIPGTMVNSVSEVPLGAHPQNFPSWGMGIREFDSYDADYDFMRDYRAAARDRNRLAAWLKEWIADCPTHEDYLRKLGAERVAILRSKVNRNSWKHTLEELSETIPLEANASNTERMISAAAREIKNIVLKNRYKTILTGMGASILAAWLAYYLLREEGYAIKPIVGIGLISYSPRPGDPQNCSILNTLTAEMMANELESYGVLVGGLNNRCLSILGAGQIDKYGNINSSRTSGNSYLIGSGGANDAVNAEAAIVVTPQNSGRFVEEVNYVTCPGNKVKMVISDKGVFEKLGADREFTLTRYISGLDLPTTKEAIIRAIKESCGWDLKVSPDIAEVPPPTKQELAMLSAFDPKGLFRTKRERR